MGVISFAKKYTMFIYASISHIGLPRWLRGKGSACNARDAGLIPGSGRSPGGRHGNPIPVFLPGESHGRGALQGLQSMGSQRVGHD